MDDTWESVTGEAVPVPDPERLVHLQFRRFAGCPVCHLHLRQFVLRHAEIEAAGVREVVVFHTPAEELREHVADLPFVAIADPQKRRYREYGIESSPRALLDPRAWPAILRGVGRTLRLLLTGRAKAPSARPAGGRFGLPGDFLLAPDGRIVASKRGAHADDQWSVDELLAHARAAR
ncbi:peroxiredoxin-like family protein [Rhizomonospora bruguierae]|uniref:peroxiredoxin-like family protein n=1 Tax=Rhizomonospora bruguierae TaxID=1581705 RepID=UPI001BCE6EF5|nr:peroxiredoxin-like family protein [Micromonospora sp. NBRC 107566]